MVEQLSLAVLKSLVSWHGEAAMCFVLQTVPVTFIHLKYCHSTPGVIREDFQAVFEPLCLSDEEFHEKKKHPKKLHKLWIENT